MATKNRGITQDISRGTDISLNRMQMAIWSFLRLLLVALGGGLSIAIGWVSLSTTDGQRTMWFWHQNAAIRSAVGYAGGLRIDAGGRSAVVSYRDVLGSAEITQAAADVSGVVWQGITIGLTVAFVSLIAWLYMARKTGAKWADDTLIRGGELAEADDVARTLRKEKRASDLRFGPLPMVLDSETRHTLICGTVGAGKSQLQAFLLEQIRARGDAAVIYDKTGELVARFYDPSRGDVILNPLDARSPAWTPFAEIGHPADAVRMAEALYPEPEKDPFFALAARAVWANAVLRLRGRPGRDMELLLWYLTVAPPEELATLVEGTDATRFLGPRNSAGDVLAQVAQGLAAFKFLPAKIEDGYEFSIRDWVGQLDQTQGRKPWLFISSRDDWHKALRPLISLWFDCVASRLLSLPPDPKRRLWLMLDELPSLNKMPSIPAVLAEGRKYGASGVLGLQTVAQLREIYGQDGTEALSGLCNTLVVFRTPDPTTAQYMGKALGERDIEETRESLRYSSAASDDAVQIMEQRQVRPVVLPTEIMQLPDLEFYIRLPGKYPIVRTKIMAVDRPTVAPAYELAPPERSAWVVLENAALAAAEAARSATPNPAAVDGGEVDAVAESLTSGSAGRRGHDDEPRQIAPAGGRRSRDLI